MSKALRFRAQQGIGMAAAVCAVDAALSRGVDVWIQELPSIDGVYARGRTPRIIVSSLRPAGRRMFTCAHELGHHEFSHGTSVDERAPDGAHSAHTASTQERQADGFAGGLLMPATAVQNAFHRRGWDPAACTPVQAHALSHWFGVSYAGLLEHLTLALRLMPPQHRDRLRKFTPKDLRAALLPEHAPQGHLALVDLCWHDRAIDIETGDTVALPPTCHLVGECCTVYASDAGHTFAVAVRPGTGCAVHSESGWSAYVRVSRAAFTGRARFRHLEDTDE